ncbi:hypothetical protein CBR_g6364 [Chara braunii]|uniref:Uncharacterized protein n=1 Tax=Chara braunii TaxID=69332 RepID=A0A388KJK4_CHABU|nr:hypothetical protein CBR_g6364 [Chara braunii]|eukprot:GBG70234.1 hypothetical protein CBR_g6364 [Chara braunii]
MAAFAAVNGATTAGLDPDVGRLCALCSGATCRSDRSGSFFPARRRSGSGNSAGGGGKRQTSTNASSLGRREGVILNSPFLRRGGLKNGDGTSPAALLSSILLTWQCRSRRGSLTKLAGNDKRMMMTESSPVRSASQNWREETKGSTSETWREETRGSTSQTVSKRGEEVKCGCGVEKIGGNDRESGQLRSGHVSRRTQEEDSPSRQSTTYEQRGKLTRERERAESGEATEDRRGEVATSNAATWRVLNGGDDTWRPRRTISFHRRLDRATPAALASISSSISSSSPVEELAGREENDEVMNVRRSFEEWCMRELEMAKREGNRKRERAISEKRAAMMRARIDSWFRKLRGRVKPGEVENPIPDNAITFAQFKELLRLQAVNHIQYGDQGRKLAVILPYANKEGSRSGKQPVEFHRHEVKPVPADGWSDIWQDLHRQVAHIEVIPPPSPFQPFTHLSKMYLAIVPGTWLAWRLLAWALPQPVQKEGPHMRQLELWERKERRWRRQSRTLELFDTEAKPQQDSTSAINVIGKARNEAAILQVRYNSDYVSGRELNEAYEKQNPNYYAEKEVDTGEETLTKVAYREAAICVLECYFPETKQYLLKTDVNGRAQFPNTQFGYKTSRTTKVVRPEEGTGVTFDDVAGIDYVKTELMQIVEMLKSDDNEYTQLGLYCPKGVLLWGPPERLMETLELTGDEIRQIFDESPRIPQEPVPPVNEQEVLLYTGRWGIHGVSLPGRVTFSPGNCGYATFGAPRPHQVRVVSDTVWDYLKARSESVVAKRAELAEEDKRAEELEIQHDNRKQSLLEFLAV